VSSFIGKSNNEDVSRVGRIPLTTVGLSDIFQTSIYVNILRRLRIILNLRKTQGQAERKAGETFGDRT